MTKTISANRYSRQIESLIEAILGLAFLVVLNAAFFPDDPGYLSVSPHPFLFLVILIASRYGTFDGFICGLLCASVFVGYLFWNKDLAGLNVTAEWSQFIPAYLFILLGLLLGEIREVANREVSRLQVETGSLIRRNDDVVRENALLMQVKDELQQRVLSADDPLSEFYQSAQRLQTLRPDEAYPAVMDLVGRFTGAEKFALYQLADVPSTLVGAPGGRVFTLRQSRGWSNPTEFEDRLDETHPAVARAVERREVTVVKEAVTDSSKGDILACAPMVDASKDEVMGLIVIERIPFMRLTQMTVSHLFTIAGWAGKALADARRFDSAMDARVDDETTGTYNFRFLTQRLAEEAQRVRRYGGSCSYLLVNVVDVDTLGIDERRLVLRETGLLVRKLLRTMDVVGVHRTLGSFGIILPSTSSVQASIVTSRVNESFRKGFGGYGSRFAHLRLRMGIASTTGAEPLSEARLMEEAERLDLVQGR